MAEVAVHHHAVAMVGLFKLLVYFTTAAHPPGTGAGSPACATAARLAVADCNTCCLENKGDTVSFTCAYLAVPITLLLLLVP
jgi:hypothetical protein